MTSSLNITKLTARNTSDPEKSNISDREDDEKDNDGQNRTIIPETDCSLYHKNDLVASFLSNQVIPSSKTTVIDVDTIDIKKMILLVP